MGNQINSLFNNTFHKEKKNEKNLIITYVGRVFAAFVRLWKKGR